MPIDLLALIRSMKESDLKRLIKSLGRDQLKILQREFGIDDCQCNLDPCACRGIGSKLFYLPIDKQELILELLDPKQYRQRAPPPERTSVMSQEAKVEVMRKRVDQGFSPFHRGDWLDWHNDVGLVHPPIRTRNGTSVEGPLEIVR